MLEVEPTGQRGCTTTRSGQNNNETIAGAASEAFLGGCTINMLSSNCDWQGHIVLPCDTLWCLCEYIYMLPAMPAYEVLPLTSGWVLWSNRTVCVMKLRLCFLHICQLAVRWCRDSCHNVSSCNGEVFCRCERHCVFAVVYVFIDRFVFQQRYSKCFLFLDKRHCRDLETWNITQITSEIVLYWLSWNTYNEASVLKVGNFETEISDRSFFHHILRSVDFSCVPQNLFFRVLMDSMCRSTLLFSFLAFSVITCLFSFQSDK